MAIYRNISLSFWTDTKVTDDFTPEDRYFMLYCLTNPHTNIIGCYEISIKQMSNETGYTTDAIMAVLKRFTENHKMIAYDFETKELYIKNWSKYNWTTSDKIKKPIIAAYNEIKSEKFKAIMGKTINEIYGSDTVSIPYVYGSDTTVTVTDTITETETNTISISDNDNKDNRNKSKNNKGSNISILPKKKKTIIDDFPCVAEAPAELHEVLGDFAEMRKKIKSPLTDRAMKLAISKAVEYANGDTETVIAIFNQSIMNGWKGIFPLHSNDTNINTNTTQKGKSGRLDWIDDVVF